MVGSERLFVDCERPTQQGLGLRIPALVVQQRGDIAQAFSHVAVVRTQRAFFHRERAAVERFGLGRTAERIQQRGQVVQAVGDLRVFGAKCLLSHGDGPAP